MALAFAWFAPQAASAQTPLIRQPGEFCNVDQVAVTPSGQALECDNVDANGRHHWILATGATTTTTAPPDTTPVTTAPPDTAPLDSVPPITAPLDSVPPITTPVLTTPPTTVATFPNTGSETNRQLALGALAVTVGVALLASVKRRRTYRPW
jgi:LPXTG-motif cell wall-anchored protein